MVLCGKNDFQTAMGDAMGDDKSKSNFMLEIMDWVLPKPDE